MPTYVTLAEIKELLEKEQESRELTTEQKQALSHAQASAKLDTKKTHQLVEDLKKVSYVSDWMAVKIADLLPDHPDDLRAIYAKERTPLNDNQIKEVLAVVENYHE